MQNTDLAKTVCLNKVESLEWARKAIQEGGTLIEEWLRADKLEASEELGDLVSPTDPTLALSIYLIANVTNKIIQYYSDSGKFKELVQFVETKKDTPDFISVLRAVIRSNVLKKKSFAEYISQDEESLAFIAQIIDLMETDKLMPGWIPFLEHVLKNNRPTEGELQTRLLEVTMLHDPSKCVAILESSSFTHYNRERVNQLLAVERSKEKDGHPAVQSSSAMQFARRDPLSQMQMNEADKGLPADDDQDGHDGIANDLSKQDEEFLYNISTGLEMTFAYVMKGFRLLPAPPSSDDFDENLLNDRLPTEIHTFVHELCKAGLWSCELNSFIPYLGRFCNDTKLEKCCKILRHVWVNRETLNRRFDTDNTESNYAKFMSGLQEEAKKFHGGTKKRASKREDYNFITRVRDSTHLLTFEEGGYVYVLFLREAPSDIESALKQLLGKKE